MPPIPAWLTTSTTGQGATLLLGTLMAISSGQLSLHEAIPAFVGAVVLIIWPQSTALAAAAKTTSTDLEVLFDAYRIGATHGAAAAAPALIPAPAAAPAPATPNTGAAL